MRRLEQFVAVARTGSLGKAAQELGMTQPTLTRNMRGLETDLGSRLFARGPSGTMLTPAGDRFLPRAEELLNGLERALAEIDEEGAQATLKLGISPNFHFDLIPGAINRNVQENPLLNIHVISATREQIVEDLRRKEMDLGFCLIPTFFYTRSTELSEIEFEALGEELILPYVRPDHPYAAVTRLEDTAGIRWAVPHQVSVSYRFESAFYRNKLPVPPQSLNATSLSLLRSSALESDMAALLPTRYAKADVEAGRLAVLDIEAMRFDFVFGFMERRGVQPSPVASRFKSLVRAALGGVEQG
ncbi:LysR family transcriptional regulator [Novosphingobium resinovorum]|uniref:LysR family transcriptional regulator n=1 Tax=Novosphingobium resinovorum TaxID=158500 RepID=UPI002ED5845C|nr:LysR family transcriptional regulator [Novosphingobium resinovorum]